MDSGRKWRCIVCGFVHSGDFPPKECPQCSSNGSEFRETSGIFTGFSPSKKADVLLINGSVHTSHNSGLVAGMAEKALKEKGISFFRINIGEMDIRHCWCCYSMAENACTYPCRNQDDDMPAIHKAIANSKAVIVISPINWNSMPSKLKALLDRTTCLQNLPSLDRESLTAGKVVGIFIVGHEDGAIKTAMDIFVYFQQMGFILAPFGFGYRTHGADKKPESDSIFLENDKRLERDVYGLVNNVTQMVKLETEKIRGNLKPVCE